MSLQNFIQDSKKLWLNGRVNNLTIDGTLTIPDTIQTFTAEVGGTFIDTPFNIDISYKIFGSVRSMTIPPVVIPQAEQLGPSGTLTITGVPVNLQSSSSVVGLGEMRSGNAGDTFGFILMNSNSNIIKLVPGTNTNSPFMSGTQDNGLYGEGILIY